MDLEQRVAELETFRRQVLGDFGALIGVCMSLIRTHPDRKALGESPTRMLKLQADSARTRGSHPETIAAMNMLMDLFHQAVTESPASDLSQATKALAKIRKKKPT